MEPPSGITDLIGLFFVIVGLILGWLVQAVLGGFRFGKLARVVEVPIQQSDVQSFLGKAHQRLLELGFRNTGVPWQYEQSGVSENPLAFAHARSPKRLGITMDQSQPPHAVVRIALEYVNSVAADTGESAYRDAVLDYVSGRTDAMKVVPNRSFIAVCAAVGSIIAWAVVAGMWALRIPFFTSALTLGGTYFVSGILGIITILCKRREIAGLPWAIAGTLLSLLLLLAAVATKVQHASVS